MAGHDTLPTELLQEILLLADIESFHAACLTCKSWRAAALSAHLLRRHLSTVPALHKANIDRFTPSEIVSLFEQICRKHLIGLRHTITATTTSRETTWRRSAIPLRTKSGCCFAQLRGLTLTFTTPASGPHEIQLSSSIFPKSDAVRQLLGYNHGGAFCSRPFARMQACLSHDGGILAVALGTRVQVYFLSVCDKGSMEMRMEMVEGVIGENALEAIQGVQFESNGLLRVEVEGGEGAFVRYLGFGACQSQQLGLDESGSRGKLAYWEKALQNVYLDSRVIEQALGDGTSIRGLRAVNASDLHQEIEDATCSCQNEKTFFALFRRPTCDNSYAVGCVSTDGAVRVTQQIPTRRPNYLDGAHGSKSFSEEVALEVEASSNPALRWDRFDAVNLPLAHSFSPLLAASDDGRILVIAEPPHGQAKGALYVCWGESAGCSDSGFEAWPFVLDTLNEGFESLRVTRYQGEKGRGYVIDAQTEGSGLQWRMHTQ
ncbi:hypothetical protein BDW74DRAFT_180841 [Aspergillus multicolor]|uniref:F-box protein n=1 Tax=Aspergillus multicolor TaxID=41759 RepID=UPI003CCCB32A